MMKGDHGQTNQLHDINWDVLDCASRAPQLMSCNYYYVCVCVCVCVCACVCVYVCEVMQYSRKLSTEKTCEPIKSKFCSR